MHRLKNSCAQVLQLSSAKKVYNTFSLSTVFLLVHSYNTVFTKNVSFSCQKMHILAKGKIAETKINRIASCFYIGNNNFSSFGDILDTF